MKIGIIGLGHLGQYILRELKSDFEVFYTNRNPTSSDPFQLKLDYPQFKDGLEKLYSCDYLISLLPPGLKYGTQLKDLINEISVHFKGVFIFTSSTSVYGRNQKEFLEDSSLFPETQNGQYLKEIEESIQKSFKSWIIARPSGLISEKRNPKNFFRSGSISNALDYVNLIHVVDVARAYKFLIQSQIINEKINLSYPMEISKEEFYKSFNSDLEAQHDQKSLKIIRSQKLLKYGFQFHYDPIDLARNN